MDPLPTIFLEKSSPFWILNPCGSIYCIRPLCTFIFVFINQLRPEEIKGQNNYQHTSQTKLFLTEQTKILNEMLNCCFCLEWRVCLTKIIFLWWTYLIFDEVFDLILRRKGQDWNVFVREERHCNDRIVTSNWIKLRREFSAT